MRVCLICEGSYPYVAGGVAGWVQMLCQNLKDTEFVIWSIATTREEMSEYKYKLPDNIVDVKTCYLGDDTFERKYKKVRLPKKEADILRQLVSRGSGVMEWQSILEFIKKYNDRLVDILMGEDFYQICLEEYNKTARTDVFVQYLWTIRGMYFPFMNILSSDIVKADVYHSLSTGYAGILGSVASYMEYKPFILSEHGIYTREREEDIIRSEWVSGGFKEYWIDFFKKMSTIAYQQAKVVTSLFQVNKSLQIELNCPEEKICIIPNGVAVEEYSNLVSYNKLSKDQINIATVLRVVPIKDVKTMLLAFQIVNDKIPNAHLAILGGYDESPEYYQECLDMIRLLDIKNVTFYGRVNVKEYMPDIDLLLLSSISEGQPLAILEGMAAGIPFICTNVGDCKNLLEGNKDEFGKAGYIVPVMDSKEMANAIISMINNPEMLKKMGAAGRERVKKYYRKESFLEKYKELYQTFGGEQDGRNRI